MMDLDYFEYYVHILIGVFIMIIARLIVGRENQYSLFERERLMVELRSSEEQRKSIEETLKDQLVKKRVEKALLVAESSREEQLIENERQRIKEALHDFTVQQLVTIAVHLENTRELSINHKLTETLDFTIDELYKTIDSLRYLIHNFNLPEIENKSLSQLVRQLESESNQYLRLRVVVGEVNRENSSPLTSRQTQELFLIVKEALQNSIKYTKSTYFNIHLNWSYGLELALEDNGYGLRPGAKVGIGMVSMQKRAESIGAEFDFVNKPASGLTILVKLPPNSLT